MKKVSLKLRRLSNYPFEEPPRYQTVGASGLDLYAAFEGEMAVPPGEVMDIPTGLAMAIPPGYEGQVRPRSGLALNHRVGVLNSPGTVDSDYRGEIRVILVNLGHQDFVVRRGDRIAQLVISPVIRAEIEMVEELDHTHRGGGGFGHTGLTSTLSLSQTGKKREGGMMSEGGVGGDSGLP